MKKGEERKLNILKDLQEQEFCTYEYLMTTYHMSESSMKKDIKELVERGYQIKGRKAQRGYTLLNKEETADREYCEASDAQKIRQLFLTLLIQNHKNGMTQEEIRKAMELYNGEKQCTEETLAATLKEMVSSRILFLEKEQKRYYVSDSAPLQMQIENEEAMKLLDRLEMYAIGHHYEDTLQEVCRKLRMAIFQDIEPEEMASNYVVYHKSYETAKNLEKLLQKFSDCPYEEKVLKITYQDRQGKDTTLWFSVGNVVYSLEKDKLYFLGDYKGHPMILDVERIQSFEVTEKENTVFQNAFYTDIVDTMFAVSVEPLVHVVVEFDDVFKIRSKVEQMMSNRRKMNKGKQAATLTENDGILRYEDDIRGLSDFANYLRRFGSNCRVIEPESLKNMMRDSALRVLRAYEEMEETS